MRHERNGCYSSSNNPNGISNQIKSIQNGKESILNISPTCLNWRKMEALLTVIWRYMQSTSKFRWGLLTYSLRTHRGCVCRIGFLHYLILLCKMQILIRSCKMNSLICLWISKLNHCLNAKTWVTVPCKYRS